MRTKRWLTVVSMVLVLVATGAAEAQVEAGDKKQSAAKAGQKRAQVEAAQKKAPVAVEAEAVKPAAAEKAEAEPAAAGDEAAATPPAAEAPAEAATAEGAAAERAAEGEPAFFEGQEGPYRFLQRADGGQRHFPEQRTEANPTGPPLRMEPEPARVRGDAGAAIAIGLAFEQDWNLDEGYDLFGEDDVAPRIGVWFGHDLLSLGERTILAGEIGVGSGMDTTSGEFDSMETTLQNTRLQVAACLRHVIWPVLQPHLRLAGHLSFLEAKLDFGDDERFKDEGFSGGGSLGAGFTVRTPTRLFENRKGGFASLSIGVLLEGGYMLASPVSFDLVEDEPTDRIEVRKAPLGELALSGPYFRSSLLVRF